jgi:23S rRNA pseudouridine2457 synthase
MRSTNYQYFAIYKPFHVLSQFSTSDDRHTLKDFFHVPTSVYPVGRLDYDSEGLLILTDDPQLNHQLLHPSFAHEREYWVQVEGDIGEQGLQQMLSGLTITIDGKPWLAKARIAEKFNELPPVSERTPPIRFRKNIPSSWIRLTLTEGKNRQVRKMTAKAGYPTLRLIRYRIGGLELASLSPGNMLSMKRQELYSLLFGENKL